jgi:hypothetical protein
MMPTEHGLGDGLKLRECVVDCVQHAVVFFAYVPPSEFALELVPLLLESSYQVTETLVYISQLLIFESEYLFSDMCD